MTEILAPAVSTAGLGGDAEAIPTARVARSERRHQAGTMVRGGCALP